jgi:mitosis inhibitor protein kinase SWE1
MNGMNMPTPTHRSSEESLSDREFNSENMAGLEEKSGTQNALDTVASMGAPRFRPSRPKSDYLLVKTSDAAPMKSSPLKRSDGIMNFDEVNQGSPVAKRRSLHGACSTADFSIFDQDESQSSLTSSEREVASPTPKQSFSICRSQSLRKSAFDRRLGVSVRGKSTSDDFANMTQRQRNRLSLDSLMTNQDTPAAASPLRQIERPMAPMALYSSVVHHQPHPLSNAVSSSPVAPHVTAPGTDNDSSIATRNDQFELAEDGYERAPFARSLPLGVPRPVAGVESLQTPAAIKTAKLGPMTTGLISKRYLNKSPPKSYGPMPDTPSKKAVHQGPLMMRGPPTAFGVPNTPYNPHAKNSTPEVFGKRGNIFGAYMNNNSSRPRSLSFASIDGDEKDGSPSKARQPFVLGTSSQSSSEDLPLTPTKPYKENSLRSSLFGRRPSVAPDTFVPVASNVSGSPLERKSKSLPSLAIISGLT